MNQSYLKMSQNELQAEYNAVKAEYDAIKAQGLNIDMSRGKPGSDPIRVPEFYPGRVGILHQLCAAPLV